MKNAKSWGLVVVLGVVVLGGVGRLLIPGIRVGNVEIMVIPFHPRDWGFMAMSDVDRCAVRQFDAVALGPFGVKITRPWTASQHSTRGGMAR
jgi:hypothetical protein